MKRLVFCFDGTWNRIDSEYPTNVAKLASMVAHADGETRQLIYYDEGVGTERTDRLTGGILGRGLFDNVVEAYHFLVLNHEVGDEIFVFGFSRGAFTARSFVGLIRNCGIVPRRALGVIGDAIEHYKDRTAETKPGAQAMREFRYMHRPDLALLGDREWRALSYPGDKSQPTDLHVRYVGVWDTVGALGIPAQIAPSEIFRRQYQFHDCELSSFVQAARHAVAADERRQTFSPALWDNLDILNSGPPPHKYQQMIFPGTHGSVGGGGIVTGLSDEALEWVIDGARAEGLAFDTGPDSPIHLLRPDHRASLFNTERSWKDWLMDAASGLGFADREFASIDLTAVHPSLVRRFHEPAEALPEEEEYRPKSLEPLWNAIGGAGARQAATGTKAAGDAPQAPPERVRSHVVQAGDTLEKLAGHYLGGKQHAALIFRHNQLLGRMHDPNRLYVGQAIEIPIYEAKALKGG